MAKSEDRTWENLEDLLRHIAQDHTVSTIGPGSVTDADSHPDDVASFWSIDDPGAINGLIYMTVLAQREALQTKNHHLLHDARRLFVGLVQLQELMQVLHQHPRSSITRIGEALGGLSRNGVYCRISMVGLRPEDICDPAMTMMPLVHKSKALGPIAQKILSLSVHPEVIQREQN
ncbi:MAG: hypothetical protein A3G57_03995 [Candidatus Andersenbacteria bacterium RIFCSPLOWO2_12_FULL_45_8]|nr:MAG: hypothetical protein A3G57_03995 [Candidatus Andersenbacteria bacterium RIFCSPLOWO2_12_FULL_45_8]